jgi:hypothetical protein
MRRGTVIVLLFIIVAVAIVGASQFLRSQPPLEITIAVSPLAEDWVRSAVDALNATEPVVGATRRIRFRVEPIDDMSVWLDDRRLWTTDSHPAGWIPAASVSVDYAAQARLPLEVVAPSLARTPLVWGGFASRVDALTNGTGALDWGQVADAARLGRWSQIPGGQSGWGNLTLAFSHPARSIAGLGVLFSGAADYAGAAEVSGTVTGASDFRDWIRPVMESVPNFITLGDSPAQAMASRGASIGEIALLPEQEWLTHLRGQLQGSDPLRLAYPEYPFVFDFPLVRWADIDTPNEEQAAIDVLSAWLMGEARQAALVDHGLRPAQGDVPETAGLFVNAQPYGALLTPDLARAVQAPPRTDTQRLLTWLTSSVIR